MTTKSSKKATTMTNAHATSDKILVLSLGEIDVDLKWNSRSPAEASGGPDEESDGFAGLVKSIAINGQDTPVSVRPSGNPKKPYRLVAGFRRFAAISKIADETGDKKPTIKAIVSNLTDEQARYLNLRENTARDDLSGPDLAFGVFELAKLNPKLTGTAIAEGLGMNQGYISRLLRIMQGVKPSITASWRAAAIKLSGEEMETLIGKGPSEQETLYTEMTRTKGEKGTSNRGPNGWIETAKTAAQAIGTMLGNLAREGQIELINDSDNFFGDNIRTLVSFKTTIKEKGKEPREVPESVVAKIAHAAEKAFEHARDNEPGEDTTSEDDAKRAKAKAKAKTAKKIAAGASAEN